MLMQPMTGKNDRLLGYIVYSSDGIHWKPTTSDVNQNSVKRFTNNFKGFKK